jgi:hypothetical protein
LVNQVKVDVHGLKQWCRIGAIADKHACNSHYVQFVLQLKILFEFIDTIDDLQNLLQFILIQKSEYKIGRIHALVDNFKMALDCFFAVWFVVGNVWIFGGRSSSSDAPNLYR